MRLATFNIHHALGARGGRVDLEQYAAAVASLDADVVALQEVDRGQPRSHGADLAAVAAAAMGATDHRFAAAMAGEPGSWAPAVGEPAGPAYGVALLSRHPVSAWDVVRLPPGRVDTEQRVALVASLLEAPESLTVVATHLSFAPWTVRRHLALLLEALADRPRPLALLGDLNHSRPRTPFTAAVSAPTFPARTPWVQLDHILLDGLASVSGEARRLPVSDHRALIADVTRV